MALKVPSAPTIRTIAYTGLLGHDLSQHANMIDRRHSPDMLNMISDEGGNPVEADEVTEKILRCAARELLHDFWKFQIICDGKDRFVFVELKVNWSDPCSLYRYDAVNDTLIPLCRWQNVDFKGIRVLQEWEE